MPFLYDFQPPDNPAQAYTFSPTFEQIKALK